MRKRTSLKMCSLVENTGELVKKIPYHVDARYTNIMPNDITPNDITPNDT